MTPLARAVPAARAVPLRRTHNPDTPRLDPNSASRESDTAAGLIMRASGGRGRRREARAPDRDTTRKNERSVRELVPTPKR